MTAPRRPGRHRRSPPAWLASLLLILAAAAGLQAAVASGLVSGFLLPAPSEIAASLPRLAAEEGLVARAALTAGEVALAAAAAAILGGAIGWMLHRSPDGWRAFSGAVAGMNALPLVLLYPLFLVLFGRSLAAVIVLGILGALPPVILKTREAFAGVPPVLLRVGRGFGLTPAQEFRLIRLPAAMPVVAAGLRLGVFQAVAAVVGAEFVTGLGGLGALVPELAERYDLPAMYGAMLAVVLVSVALLVPMQRLERWLRPR